MNRHASGVRGIEGEVPEVRLCRDSWAEIIVWLAGQEPTKKNTGLLDPGQLESSIWMGI